MAEESKDKVINVGEMVIYKNALIYQNSAIQISNISFVWVADQSYVVRHNLPTWISIFLVGGGLSLIWAFLNQNFVFGLVGIILVAAACWGYKKHKPETPIRKYALGVERASGGVMLFTAPDKDFVQKAAKALVEAISSGKGDDKKVVMNFDNKRINIENALGSNIVGGDVDNSLVGSFK